MYWEKSFFILFLLPALVTCKESGHPQEEVYDYRDEKHQDTYSRYMRKTGLDYLIITPENIKDSLGLESVPDGLVGGRMDVFRLDPSHINNSSKSNIEYYFNLMKINNFKYGVCKENDNIENLLCIQRDYPHFTYFYSNNDSRGIKYINQEMVFSCNIGDDGKNCKLLNQPIGYNLDIYIYFNNPQNFFYIMPYVEKHFYETTGEHLWQTLPSKN